MNLTHRSFIPPEDAKYEQMTKLEQEVRPYANLGFRPKNLAGVQSLLQNQMQKFQPLKTQYVATYQNLQANQQFIRNAQSQEILLIDYPKTYSQKDQSQTQIYEMHCTQLPYKHQIAQKQANRYVQDQSNVQFGFQNNKFINEEQNIGSQQNSVASQVIQASRVLSPLLTQSNDHRIDQLSQIFIDQQAFDSKIVRFPNPLKQNQINSKILDSTTKQQCILNNHVQQMRTSTSQRSNTVQIPEFEEDLFDLSIQLFNNQDDNYKSYEKLSAYIGLAKLNKPQFLIYYDKIKGSQYQQVSTFLGIQIIHFRNSQRVKKVQTRFINRHHQLDIKSFLPGGMLNDEAFDYLGFKLMSIFNNVKFISCRSFDLNSIMQHEIQDYNYKDSIFSGWVSNNHWIGCFISFTEKVIYYFDGLNSLQKLTALSQFGKIFKNLDAFDVIQLQVPYQQNCFDCGYYLVLTFVFLLNQRFQIDFSSEDIRQLRYNMLALLLTDCYVVTE